MRGLADVGRGAIEIILNSGGMYAVSDEDVELLRGITRASGRPVTWLALFAHPGEPDYHDQTFAKLGDLVKRAVPQVTPRPIMSQGDLKNPTMFGSFVSWQKAFNRPVVEQMALYRDAAFREAFRQELESRKRTPHVGPDARAGGRATRAGGARRAHARGDRGEPGQAPGGRVFRPRARRRPGDAVSVVDVQLRPGGHRAPDHGRPLPHRAVRRRGARRLHLRRRLRDRAARSVGAAARCAEPREGRPQADAGPGRRSSAFRTAACCRKARSPTSCCSTPRR